MAAPTTRHVLSVFLASPGDVPPERKAAQEVITVVNKILGRPLGVLIDLHVWEEISPGYGEPQSRINPEVDACDLFIGLLWERWGQPTKAYSSGFHEEFERAITRRRNTGEPEIWLVFKAPRSAKLDEPGPQLSEVLKFRDQQKASKEVHFAEVESCDQWANQLQTWLFDYVLRVSGISGPRTADAQAVSSPTAPSSLGSDPSVGVRESNKEAVRHQLVDLAVKVAKVVQSGELEFSRSETDRLSEFEIVRLCLLSATWVANRYTGDFLTTHQINLLYRYRQQVDATTPEFYQLLRTLVKDEFDVNPGWFWFRDDFPSGPADTLLGFATQDTNKALREKSLKLMTQAKIRIPKNLWASLPVAEDNRSVSLAALEYLGEMGDEAALPLIEAVAAGPEDLLPPRALEATSRIVIRTDPNKAFSGWLSYEQPLSSKLAQSFVLVASSISTENLLKGAVSDVTVIREFSVRELDRRGSLSLELAESLRRDSSIEIRQTALQVLVNERGRSEIEQLRQQRRQRIGESGSAALYFGKSDIDYDSLTLNYYRTLPTNELLDSITWSAVDGVPAYRVLASDRFESISQFVRNDLANGFGRIRDDWIGRVRSTLGDEYANKLSQEYVEGLDDFIRKQFTAAALHGLAAHAEPSDINLARKFLRDENQDVALAAIEIVSKFGEEGDVPALQEAADHMWGEAQELAAAAAIQLSTDGDQVALGMLKSEDRVGSKAAYSWLVRRDSPQIREYFRSSLNDESESNRLRGVYYNSTKLNHGELETLLSEYLENARYYYNVVTWLDRILYSPPTLREMFIRELEKQASP